jgi:quinol monooxygenase YgiN
MFARVCELHIKPEKKEDIISVERDVILPMLEHYDGFFDLIPLELDTHPRKFFAISLWRDERDAEKYAKECFPKVYDMLEPFLTAPISVKSGTIDETITKTFVTDVVACR